MTFDNLLRVCRALAKQPLLTQGSGANVSLKLAPNDMRIKASGFSFNEITPDQGLVSVDAQHIRAFYDQTNIPDEDEASFRLLSGSPRPSMETGFHAFLDRAVIHTHPVQTNIIACLEEGERFTREIYGDSVRWVPYVTPGHPLAKKMFDITKNEKEQLPNAFILQNHGLIVTGPSVDFCWQLHERIITQTEQYLQKKIGTTPTWPTITFTQDADYWTASNPLLEPILNHPWRTQELLTQHPFPDSVVFLDNATIAPTLADVIATKAPLGFVSGKGLAYKSSEKRAREFEDVVTASFFIREFGSLLGSVRYLNEHEITAIRNSPFEKYRQQVKQ